MNVVIRVFLGSRTMGQADPEKEDNIQDGQCVHSQTRKEGTGSL